MQLGTEWHGLTSRKPNQSEEFKESSMSLDLNGNLVEVAAVMIPVVGSIALFSFLSVAVWSDARRKERQAYYQGETLKKITESSGEGARAAIELLHEQEKNIAKSRTMGLQLGGLVTTAVGIGVMALLHGLVHDEPVYLAGVIPLLIGVALLLYVFLLAPKI
jgi:hypothetical protein